MAMYVGRVLSRVGNEWPKDSLACKARRSSMYLPRFLARRAAARTDFQGGVVRARGHRLIEEIGRARCIDCLGSARCRATICNRSCAKRAVGLFAGRPHRLRNTAGLVWCSRCGYYSQFKVRGLRKSCRGYGRAPRALARLRLDLHPLTGGPLDRCLLEGSGAGGPQGEDGGLVVCGCSACTAGTAVDKVWRGLWDVG